ncbi:DUF4292 domain-containing protein [Candidatus Latescibacterota bacterium]
MKNIVYGWLTAFIAVTVFAVQGCGKKPDSGVPGDITPLQALSAIERQSQSIDTFSGTASVKVLVNGASETATVLIRYINPGLFRVYLKGFAGIDIGRISALEDSVTVYIPPENIYLKAGRDEYILERLFPEIDLDVKTVELLFNGTFPAEEDRGKFEMSMKHVNDQLDLTMVDGNVAYLYRIGGSDLHLISEEYSVNKSIVWRKTLTGYKSYDGIKFPEEITIERGDDSFTILFSKCEINTGLTESDLSFAVPSSAERVYIENRR